MSSGMSSGSTTITLTTSRGTSTHVISMSRGVTAGLFWCTLWGFVIYIIGFATTDWFVWGDNHYGLWKSCSCASNSLGKLGWFHAVQAMITIGLIGFIVAMVLACIYMFVHALNKNTVIYGFALISLVSVIFMLIGVIVFGAKIKSFSSGHESYSFVFAIIGTILCGVACVLSVFQIKSSGATTG